MNIKINRDAVDKVQRADLQGRSKDEMKRLYIEQNMFGVDADKPVHRIVQAKYLLADIQNEKLTHVKACPLIWNSPLENPLLNYKHKDPITGETTTLERVVEDFYAVCWTVDDEETLNQWRAYSAGEPAVRITTTPRILMDRIMNVQNTYYMLHHYIGAVRYQSESEIREWLTNTHYSDFLDTLGQGLALSAMTLSTKYTDEKEVRLLYSHHPQPDAPWVNDNVVLKGNVCEIPFDWKGAISEVIIGPYMPIDGEIEMRRLLNMKGIGCDIRYSQFRNT